MYALTKVYKTKAQALNAIRMTATNKGWKVLDTDAAAQHVWPAAEGFTVNNTTLNVALGFVQETQDAATGVEEKVPAGTITDGKALEAVSAALAEQAKVEAKAPKLQAPSKLEESKKDNLIVKTKSRVAKEQAEARATRCTVVNNARRPLRGKTLLVWETTERMQKELGRAPSLKEVYAELCKEDPKFNKTTCSIQFYACRTFNGWDSTKDSK